MKIRLFVIAALILTLMTSGVSVSADSAVDAEIYNTWSVATIEENADEAVNISTIFVGKREIPMMMYVQENHNAIYWVWEATEDSPGNCGPDNAWHCDSTATTFSFMNISNLATETYPDTFSVGYSYAAYGNLWGNTREYTHSMEFISSDSEVLLDFGEFGETVALAGSPSIARIGGHFRGAVTLKVGVDFPVYKLVYIYFKGGSNDSCRSGVSSGYDCIVIEETAAGGLMGAPALTSKDGTSRLLYYKDNAIRYAYPWETAGLKPSNCGETGFTWRCIDLDAPASPTTVGAKVDMAVGRDASDLAAAYTLKGSPGSDYDSLMHASYVGSGGNCGTDKNFLGENIFTWDCGDVDNWIDSISDTRFHIAFDNRNFPVISYNNKLIDDASSRQRLYVAYWPGRVGLPGNGWDQYLVDGNDQSTTGYYSDIAFSNNGRVMIGYLQLFFQWNMIIDDTPNIKIATQWFSHTCLPFVVK